MRFNAINVIIGLLLYGGALFALWGVGWAAVSLAFVYVGACMLTTKYMIDNAEAKRVSTEIEFSKADATSRLGEMFGTFHHVFYSPEPVATRFEEALSQALQGKYGSSALADVDFRDVDRDLPEPETRRFGVAGPMATRRNSVAYLVVDLSRVADVQGIRWWVLIRGERDPNKVFWRYCLSPAIVPGTLFPWSRGTFDPLRGLHTVDAGFFNAVDVLSRVRELNYLAFETLVETLDSFGIDTSDLKLQKGNVLNVNVSGGHASFGSLVQGAFNRITSPAGPPA